MLRSLLAPILLVSMLSATGAVASADPLKPGDTLNYSVKLAWIEPINPAIPLKMIEEHKLTPQAESTSLTFTVAVDRLDPDGSAHATISPHYGNIHIRGWSFPDFEGNVMPDGQIVPKYDLTLIKGSGIDQNSSTANHGWHPSGQVESVNFSAFSFSRRLLLFNDVALGAGKKKSFKDGDAWRVVIPDKNDETINFVYKGTQVYQNSTVAALDFSTTRTTQKGVGPVTGTALYDLQRGLLMQLHFVGDDDTTQGVRTQTIDISMQ